MEGGVGSEAGIGCAEFADVAHGDDRRRETCRDGLQQVLVARAPAVELVDEDQRGDAQASQGAHQDAGLCLNAFDGRDDQDGAVEHVQNALNLGDEVGVAGSVDEVDGQVVDLERDDGGLDGDAALSFQREGVRAGAAVVDAADLVDDSDGVQQAFGEAGLTCVDVREDAEVEHA